MELQNTEMSKTSLYCQALGAAIENAASRLPAGYSIMIEVERGGGHVGLFDEVGDVCKFPTDNESLAATINDAVAFCVEPGSDNDTAQAPLALDVSLEKARALHRVWRALNDGDCPSCHRHCAATQIVRNPLGIECPSCGFYVTHVEIEDIEKMFAPAMNAALDIFIKWRAEIANRVEA